MPPPPARPPELRDMGPLDLEELQGGLRRLSQHTPNKTIYVIVVAKRVTGHLSVPTRAPHKSGHGDLDFPFSGFFTLLGE